ncbi:unnamed protein product [Cyprideis torosa]|uniref:Uncharacterized protein n=1 Tax=Cyprideis torosa TaxID=163714 RepID=A0A7R8WIT3_9CRUS|nr:unnamed protein product [Cyprideis torosa]CAG0899204.1 unnamed protein product [Cyprideis torosa]
MATSFQENGLTYSLCKLTDLPQLSQKIIEEFVVREPYLSEWNERIHWSEDIAVQEVLSFIAKQVIEDNLSLVVKDDETGAVVGFRLTALEEKHGPKVTEAFQAFELKEDVLECFGFQIYEDERVEEHALFDKYGVSKMASVLAVNVSPNFEGKGICQRMITMTNDLVRDRDCSKAIRCTAQSNPPWPAVVFYLPLPIGCPQPIETKNKRAAVFDRMGKTGFYVFFVLVVFQTMVLLTWYSRSGGDMGCEETSATFRTQRDYISKVLNEVRQKLAQAECKQLKAEKKLSISSSGGWCAEFSGKDSGKHLFDKALAKALSTFFAGKQVASFGDGPGQYQQLVTEEGKVLSYAAFDGAPFTEQTSENRVKFLDLAIPHFGLEVFDWIVSLEVVEHIPEQFEATYLDNIFRHAREGIILSWAVPKQGGTGHVNERPFSYVRDVMAKAGFAHDEVASQQLKNAAKFPWLKRNINVFRRIKPFSAWNEVMA